jgi:N6-adenosine-specific RNA methylase IME4
MLKRLRKGEVRYAAIIADPPWRYGSPRALVGNGGRGYFEGCESLVQVDVSKKYPTMSLDELFKLEIPAAPDCILFMWVTNPFLCDGSGPAVAKAWGFEPKTVLTWSKVQADGVTPSMKTGHWFRSASEHVIFAVRGNVKRPKAFPAIATWFPDKRLPHSVKPDCIHNYAEIAAPNGPWLEMFARRVHAGWDSWGDEVSFRKGSR